MNTGQVAVEKRQDAASPQYTGPDLNSSIALEPDAAIAETKQRFVAFRKLGLGPTERQDEFHAFLRRHANVEGVEEVVIREAMMPSSSEVGALAERALRCFDTLRSIHTILFLGEADPEGAYAPGRWTGDYGKERREVYLVHKFGRYVDDPVMARAMLDYVKAGRPDARLVALALRGANAPRMQAEIRQGTVELAERSYVSPEFAASAALPYALDPKNFDNKIALELALEKSLRHPSELTLILLDTLNQAQARARLYQVVQSIFFQKFECSAEMAACFLSIAGSFRVWDFDRLLISIAGPSLRSAAWTIAEGEGLTGLEKVKRT